MEFTTGHLEDALTKIIKLLANLSTEESIAFTEFHQTKSLVGKLIEELCKAIVIHDKCLWSHKRFMSLRICLGGLHLLLVLDS